MNGAALRYAAKAVAVIAGLSVGGGLTIWSAIWLPTWLLMRYGGWPFLDAYLMGAPFGLLGLCFVAIGVMAYRQKARES